MRKEGSSSSGSTSSSKGRYDDMIESDSESDNEDDGECGREEGVGGGGGSSNGNIDTDNDGINAYYNSIHNSNDNSSSGVVVVGDVNAKVDNNLNYCKNEIIEEIFALPKYQNNVSNTNVNANMNVNASNCTVENNIYEKDEEQETPGCVPSPFSNSPGSGYSTGYSAGFSENFCCPEFLSKDPGPIPRNIFKKSFFVSMKNIIYPPSESYVCEMKEELVTE